jgi:hypothetical protein
MLELNGGARGRQLLMVLRIDRRVRLQAGGRDSEGDSWRGYGRLADGPAAASASAVRAKGGS